MKEQEKKAEQTVIFGDVIWSQELDSIDNESLIDYAYTLYEQQSSVKKSNRLGFQSPSLPTTPDIVDSRFKPLVSEVVSFAQSICYDVLYKDPDASRLTFGVDAWANINPKYAYNQPHIHGGNTLLSLIYYAQTPDNCGQFYLTREDSRVDLISRFKIDNFLPLASQLYFTPTEGKLLAFPGWVTHGVGQNISDEDRISFAFNINLFSNENPMNGQRSQNENPMNGQRSQNENVNTYAY